MQKLWKQLHACFTVTTCTNRHQSTLDGRDEGPSFPDRTENLNINDEVLHVTQLTVQEKSCRQATKYQSPFIPPLDGCPIDNLPIELLSYIFTLGSGAERNSYEEQEEEGEVAGERRSHLPFQVLVSHVCRQWRAVTIETPTLWTYLDFEEGPPFNKSRTWLERSKECPLVIKLDCQSTFDLDGRSHISPADLPVVRDLILPHSARWRAFELIVYSNDFKFMNDMLSTLASIPDAPELRALSLHCKSWYSFEDFLHYSPGPVDLFFTPFCGRAPELSLVTLWGVYVDWETCIFLQGLEVIDLRNLENVVRPPYEVFAHILRRSPDLHTLTLCASGPAGDEEGWPTDVIELPSVRQHHLAKVPPSYASALLKRLVFPNLSILSLEFDRQDYSTFIEQLTSPPPKQRHSVCQNLVELKLSGQQHCSDTALGTFYAALPNLISLNINCYYSQHHYFEYLFVMNFQDPDGFYLPKLTTLTTYGISVQRMSDLIRTRRTIKHVQMDSMTEIATDVDKECVAWLRAHTESFTFFR